MTMENAVSLAAAAGPSAASASLLLSQATDVSSSSAKQLYQQSLASTLSAMSAACSSAAETGLQSQAATRRLLGQGLMNIGSSASTGIVQPPPLSRMLPVSPASAPALHPNSSAAVAGATGFACSGRQIKGELLNCFSSPSKYRLSKGEQ